VRFRLPSYRDVAVFFALFAAALFVQWKSGTLNSELGGYPDEAAHYVTSLMFHQYLTEGNFQNPVHFAENYYLHYPKVAIGHWPPAYYVLTSAWMLPFGTSIKAVLILQAVLAALVGLLLYKSLAQDLGAPIATLVSVFWITLPVTQNSYTLVMSELLLTATSLLAAMSFASFLQSKQNRSVYLWGFWTFVSVMTKGSGFAVFAIPAFAFLWRENRWILKNRRMWGTVALCAAMILPWQLWTSRMVANGMDTRGVSGAIVGQAVASVQQFVPNLGFLLATLSGLGVLVFLLGKARSVTPQYWICQLGLIVGTYVLHIVSPNGIEPRRVLMAIPSLLAFSGLGLLFVTDLVAKSRPFRLVVPVAALVIYLVSMGQMISKPDWGWRAVLASNISRYNADTPILIAGGTYAENIAISEIAQLLPRPKEYLIRSTKLLAESDWSGTEYKPRVSRLDGVEDALDNIPINVIALEDDTSPRTDQFFQHLYMVQDLVRKNPHEWKEVASGPVRTMDGRPSILRFYERRHPILTPPHVRVDVQRSLGRDIETN
jgi:hypothetical protein